MNVLYVHLDDAQLLPGAPTVGHLYRDAGRRGDAIRFEYHPDWLAHPQAFAIDPLLPLQAGPFHARDPAQPPAIFQDCAPDRWGRLLMDRRETMDARTAARPRRTLRAWDYLVGVDDGTRMGALRLWDPAGGRYLTCLQPSAPPMTSLRELEAAARLLEQDGGQDVDAQIRQLIAPGGSLGGARPKASFVDEHGALWLAKFPSAEDRHDVGLWEYVAWRLAGAAGIRLPEARLLPLSRRGHTFASRRFDRTPAGRRLYASACTLLDRESDSASYLDLAEAVETQGAAGSVAEGLEQLFRRAVFNVLVGNRDDHLRNHGFLRQPTGWTLSPAFDVNPNPHKEMHVLALDEADPTPDTRLLLDTHAYYRMPREGAAQVLEQVRASVRQWVRVAQALGAGRHELAMMEPIIDPER